MKLLSILFVIGLLYVSVRLLGMLCSETVQWVKEAWHDGEFEQ